MSKNPALLLLEHHLKELKLPTFLRDSDSVRTVCSQERCAYGLAACAHVQICRSSERY